VPKTPQHRRDTNANTYRRDFRSAQAQAMHVHAPPLFCNITAKHAHLTSMPCYHAHRKLIRIRHPNKRITTSPQEIDKPLHSDHFQDGSDVANEAALLFRGSMHTSAGDLDRR
jgi:hypothetical protein